MHSKLQGLQLTHHSIICITILHTLHGCASGSSVWSVSCAVNPPAQDTYYCNTVPQQNAYSRCMHSFFEASPGREQNPYVSGAIWLAAKAHTSSPHLLSLADIADLFIHKTYMCTPRGRHSALLVCRPAPVSCVVAGMPLRRGPSQCLCCHLQIPVQRAVAQGKAR